ncbi:MAG: hypothetical protein AAF125_11590, partial [Chloroflexota bacterium]
GFFRDIDTTGIGIADFGSQTNDLTLLRNQDIMNRYSASQPSGVDAAFKAVRTRYMTEFSTSLSEEVFQDLLRGQVTIKSHEGSRDLTAYRTEAVELILQSQLSILQSTWSETDGLLQQIYFTGGSSIPTRERLKNAGWSHASFVDDPVLANAVGYARLSTHHTRAEFNALQ